MPFSPRALQDHATLIGDRLLLTPLTVAAVSVEDYFAMIADPEGRRTTGTHASFDEAAARRYLESRPAQPDRADWAAIRIEVDAFLGEAVLNELDDDNESMNFRIALAGSHVYDRGYGTEITRLVVACTSGAAFESRADGARRCSGRGSGWTRSSCPSSPPIPARSPRRWGLPRKEPVGRGPALGRGQQLIPRRAVY